MTPEELQRDLREAVLTQTLLMPPAPPGLKRRLSALRTTLREHPLPVDADAGVHVRDSPGEDCKPLDDCTTVGSDRASDLRLDHDYVSRRHCRFWRLEDDWMVEDLDSTNGVYVNGTRVESRATLRDGDVIQVGAATLLFFRGDRGGREGVGGRLATA